MKKYLTSSLRVLFPETRCTNDTLKVSRRQCRHRTTPDNPVVCPEGREKYSHLLCKARETIIREHGYARSGHPMP